MTKSISPFPPPGGAQQRHKRKLMRDLAFSFWHLIDLCVCPPLWESEREKAAHGLSTTDFLPIVRYAIVVE